MTAAVIASVAGGAWFGYQVYLEHTKDAEIDHDLGVDERARQRAGESMDDIIDEVERAPKWNGPGNPAFGVGSPTTQP